MPAGAIPKDGPSAGVAMSTALASLLTDRTARNDTAMTGEISLRGLVLPVGGIKEKVLAAHRAGLKRVMLPARNRKDFEDIPDSARDALEFVWLEQVDDAIAASLDERVREPVETAERLTQATRSWSGTPWAHSGHACAGHMERSSATRCANGTRCRAASVAAASPSVIRLAKPASSAPQRRASSRVASRAEPALTASSASPTRRPARRARSPSGMRYAHATLNQPALGEHEIGADARRERLRDERPADKRAADDLGPARRHLRRQGCGPALDGPRIDEQGLEIEPEIAMVPDLGAEGPRVAMAAPEVPSNRTCSISGSTCTSGSPPGDGL